MNTMRASTPTLSNMFRTLDRSPLKTYIFNEAGVGQMYCSGKSELDICGMEGRETNTRRWLLIRAHVPTTMRPVKLLSEHESYTQRKQHGAIKATLTSSIRSKIIDTAQLDRTSIKTLRRVCTTRASAKGTITFVKRVFMARASLET